MNVFNSQDQHIHAIEYENDNKELNFLDVTVRNNLNRSYDFAVYCKPAIMNVQIKRHSNIYPNITVGVLKGFLSHAHLFRKMFSSRNKIFSKRFCRKLTWYYSFKKSHQRIYKQHL